MVNNSVSEIETTRHSFAHILAMAVLRTFPQSKIGIGPATETGFYYDIDSTHKFTTADLDLITKEMHKIINEELPFKQIYLPREQALDTLLQLGQTYKTELLHNITDPQISFFQTGEFLDLCRGPHLKHTGKLKFFKLTKISTVNWLNDEQRPEMQRIEGIAFNSKEELDQHLNYLLELKEKNHLKLGKNLNLIHTTNNENFNIYPEQGSIILDGIKDLLKKNISAAGFNIIQTPALIPDLKTLSTNKSIVFFEILNTRYALKYNSLYYHNIEYRTKKRGHRELPFKIGEISDFITQDSENTNKPLSCTACQTHIYANRDLVEAEIKNSLELICTTLSDLGFDQYQLFAVMPKDTEDKKQLNRMQKSMMIYEKALNDMKLVARVLPNEYSDYGPQITFAVKDIFGEMHKIASVSLDLITPETENLIYVNFENKKEKIYLIHLDLIHSIQEVFSLLIENYGGAMPLWLAPVQTVIIPISEKYEKEAKEVNTKLIDSNIRSKIDNRSKTMQYRIHDAQKKHIPYILIIGEKELNTSSVSIRLRNGQELGLVRVDEVIEKILEEIRSHDKTN